MSSLPKANRRPIILTCCCRISNGPATSKFCPDCGMPRGSVPAASESGATGSLSDQLHASLNELSMASPTDPVDSAYSVPLVIDTSHGPGPSTHDLAALDADTRAAVAMQWRAGQPLNMRAIIMSSAAVFGVCTFMFFATTRSPAGSSSHAERVAHSVGADSATAVVPNSNGQRLANAGPASSVIATSGALVTNSPGAAGPRSSSGANMPPLRLPSVNNSELAPASPSSLPQVATGSSPAPAASSASQPADFSNDGGPMTPMGSGPVFVAVAPADGAPDDLNPRVESPSPGGRNSAGYMSINGRIVMDDAAPQVTIESPNSNGNYVGYFPGLQGSATSPAGIGTVELEIERLATRSTAVAYWDGKGWTATATRLAVNVGSNGWQYTGALPDDNQIFAGYYRVKVYARSLQTPARRLTLAATQRIRVFPKGPAN